jgi:hypothetical protein
MEIVDSRNAVPKRDRRRPSRAELSERWVALLLSAFGLLVAFYALHMAMRTDAAVSSTSDTVTKTTATVTTANKNTEEIAKSLSTRYVGQFPSTKTRRRRMLQMQFGARGLERLRREDDYESFRQWTGPNTGRIRNITDLYSLTANFAISPLMASSFLRSSRYSTSNTTGNCSIPRMLFSVRPRISRSSET